MTAALSSSRPLTVGTRVRLVRPPANLERLRNRCGEVTKTEPAPYLPGGLIVCVTFDRATRDAPFIETRDIPAIYLERVEDAGQSALAATPPVRRKPRTPRPKVAIPAADPRTEREKVKEAISLIDRWGYRVIEVGAFRPPAVCHACQREGHRGPALCPKHHTKLYAPHTGTTDSAADLMIRHSERWPRWAVLSAEAKKGEKSARRAAQVRLSAAGWFPILDNLPADLLHAIVDFEADVLRLDPCPELIRYLMALEGQPL